MELGISSMGHIFDCIRSNEIKNLTDILLESIKASLEYAEQNNLGVCELMLEPPEIFSSVNQKKIIDICNSFSIKKQIHAPFIDLKMCSYNQLLSKASMESCVEAAKICDQIDSEILVIHPGSVYGGKFFRMISNEKLIERVKDLLNVVAPMFPNIKICIENMPIRTNYFLSVEEIEVFINELNRDNIFLIWDTSHSWTCDVNLEDFWKKFHKIIKNIHLADNNDKDSDKHPTLGSGEVNFPEIFDLIKKYNYNDALIVEISSAQNLTSSIEFIKKLF
ncbi:hypothetical protein LCGC14_2166210 [marine sediment metagenome]|uniref:Xylose isomerase-like TIM barrel domain-containing protein n=1 Tax=marine sediment metagenome TaxID=412755 RepID=A0A0F9G456_9ZZZZ